MKKIGNPTSSTKPTQTTKSSLRRRIATAKKAVQEMEETNYSKLILWRSDTDWWKTCRHSALIHAHYISTLTGKTVNINFDTDRFLHDKGGTTSICHLDTFIKQMATYDIKYSKEDSTEDIAIFTLPRTFTKENIADFRRTEDGSRAKINSILSGESLSPFLNSELERLTSSLYHLVCKMNQNRRAFIGDILLRDLIAINRTKCSIERGEIQLVPGLNRLYTEVSQLSSDFNLSFILQFAPLDKSHSIATHIHNLHTEIRSLHRRASQGDLKLTSKQSHEATRS